MNLLSTYLCDFFNKTTKFSCNKPSNNASRNHKYRNLAVLINTSKGWGEINQAMNNEIVTKYLFDKFCKLKQTFLEKKH